MDFLPKELEDIILDYKFELERELEYKSKHQEKMKSTLFSITNLDVDSCELFGKFVCTYYLDENDNNKIITRTQYTCEKGMRINLDLNEIENN